MSESKSQSQSTDVWFTQDGLDGDNLPATRAVAEYCESLQSQGQAVRLYLDVSTAHRDLSLPRLHAAPYGPGTAYGAGKKAEPAGATDNDGFAVEEMNGTWYGFMGNRYYVGEDGQPAALVDVPGKPGAKKAASLQVPEAIRADSLKCNEYDAVVLHSVAKTYFSGTIFVIGGNLSHQQLWDKIVPNNFLMTKVAGANVVGRSLQEFNDLQKFLDAQDPADYALVNATVRGKNTKQWRYTPNAGKEAERRSRMRGYIDEHVANYKQRNANYATITVDEALDNLASCGDRCLEVIICAPMDNVKRVLAEHAAKVRDVVGEFGSLRVSDNVVGAQWNEFLDRKEPLQSAHQAFAAMRAADYPVFFTPTQMFKNGGFPSIEAVFQKIAAAAKGSDGSNLLLSYQECWNAAKRGPQAIFDPLCVIVKRHGLFAQRANVLASSSIFGGDGSGYRTFSCPAYKVDGSASAATTIEKEQVIVFDAQDVDIITEEYLRLYDVSPLYKAVQKLPDVLEAAITDYVGRIIDSASQLREGMDPGEYVLMPSMEEYEAFGRFIMNNNRDDVKFQLVLPQGLRKIREWEFERCTSLTSVTFPDGLHRVGWGAFYECDSLTSVTLPVGLQQVGGWAFLGCSITSVTLPQGCSYVDQSSYDSSFPKDCRIYFKGSGPPPAKRRRVSLKPAFQQLRF